MGFIEMASNHLAGETSPYLLQHVDNPVDWYPWGEEALALAKDQHKPILLSIGYAACHWCHVMAHESFEDEATAELMNRWFVNIKVDREERPDLDSIYMAAVTSMTGHGGWPMTVFLTPEGKPFFCGTYFPRVPRYGMPAFSQVLSSIAEAWRSRQDEIQSSAESVSGHLAEGLKPSSPQALNVRVLEQASSRLQEGFDRQWGGFGGAPKFPQPMVLEFLLREHLRAGQQELLGMVELTLRKMAQGGMYDHLGGGFARYSTDQAWLVPHFEKMLYDNAQLARLYLHAWQLTADPFYRRVVEETLDYALREMRHDSGGFYSSQDADSEGEEGKFFVWSVDEIRAALGADAELFLRVYGVSAAGNWEGKNILNLARQAMDVAGELGLDQEQADAKLKLARRKLLQVRATRIWPGLDDKILTAWNGLMLSALAEAGRVLGRPDYLAAAVANAGFLHRELRRDDGRLLRTWKSGAGARYNAYLEDHACLAEGLLSLYESTFDPTWYDWAVELAGVMLDRFKDPAGSGFFDTSDDHERLIYRPRDLQDNAMPSGNAKATMVLFRLGMYTGESRYLEVAQDSAEAMTEMMGRHPLGFGEWLNFAGFMLGRPQELALVGSPAELEHFRAVVNESYRPNLVVAAGPAANNPGPPLLSGRSKINGSPAAYLCERFSCQSPVTDAAELRRLLTGG